MASHSDGRVAAATPRQKVLFVTPVLEYPPKGGPWLRIHNSIKALSRVADLSLYSRVSVRDMGGQPAYEYFMTHCARLTLSPLARAGFPTHHVAYRLLHRLITWIDWLDVVRRARADRPDVVWLGYGNVSYGLAVLLKSLTRARVVVDTDSVWSRFLLRGVRYERHPFFLLYRLLAGTLKILEEWVGTRCADRTTAVSEIDRQYYQRLARQPARVAVFSNVVDLDAYAVTVSRPPVPHPAGCLSGTMGPHSAMEVAALWTLQEILPLVWQRRPDFHFYLIGRGATAALHRLKTDRVTITGQVESVVPYLAQMDVALVPLKFESGTRFKILEAAACRVPVVSTSLGAEGLDLRHETHLLIADTAAEFALAIVRVLTDQALRRSLVENAFTRVTERYSVDYASQEARAILAGLAGE